MFGSLSDRAAAMHLLFDWLSDHIEQVIDDHRYSIVVLHCWWIEGVSILSRIAGNRKRMDSFPE